MTETTLSPSEVTDMVEKLKGMLGYISDTFVNASQLAETVKSLQGQVSQMQTDMDQLRQHNAALDETIQHLRQERDAAQGEASQLRNENAVLTHDRDSYAGIVTAHKQRIEELEAELAGAKRSHDDAEYRALHWEEQHNKIKEKLDAVHKSLGIAPQEVTQAPQAVPAVQATGTGW